MASAAPMMIRHDQYFATLHVLGRPSLNVFGEKQAIMFERLIEATRSGVVDVRTGTLMEGMGANSPQQIFSAAVWKQVKDHYLTQERPSAGVLGRRGHRTI